MEDKALEILGTMLAQRKLDVKVERITSDDAAVSRANVYTIGKVLVLFSQKDKILATDIANFLKFAEANEYSNGVIIVALSPPSENVLKVAKSHAKDRVQLFHIRQLQFDITTHRMAMPHRILTEEEKKKVLETFKISNPEEQLPWIDSQDPMVKWIGAIPGDVLHVQRHSDVAGTSDYYRYVVEDVNVA